MFLMSIDTIEEQYESTDLAMNDLFQIYPDAFFSGWNEDNTKSWLDVFISYSDRTIIGRIYEI